MSFSFLEPAFLWTLLIVPAVWFVPSRATNVRHALIRSAVLVFLALGLARPVLFSTDEAPHHVVVLDRTDSVTDASADQAEKALARILEELPTTAVTVVYDVVSEGGREPLSDTRAKESHVVRSSKTSLSSLLSQAAAGIPKGSPGAITLISDGRSTDRRWGEVMNELVEREIPLHTVRITDSHDDVRPVAFRLPETLRIGHTAHAAVSLEARYARVDVELRDGDQLLARRNSVEIRGTTDTVLEFEPAKSGYRNYTVQVSVVSGTDADTGNNELETMVAVQKPLRVLYLGHRLRGSGAAISKLLGRGFDVQEPDTTEAPPAPGTWDVAMLDDRPAAELPSEWQEALVEAVREHGAGMLASGGRGAFGPGGYSKTPIESALPVELVQKEEKKDPSTTLAIIIDTSGSMVGNRMTIAKQVARLAMRRLQPHDKIGIVEFYGTKQWAAPIQSAANQIDLQRALNRLGAEGGTVLMPAIEEAYYAMKNVQTRYKHVLILTDAGVETGPYEQVCRRMSDEGMTVSTVLVGPGRHSEFLVELADWGGGRYYNASDRFNLPELLLKKPSTSVLPAYRPEKVTLEGRGGSGWWGGIDPAQVPQLDGFVETELRPGAEQLISTAKTKKPILASWVHGLGRVTAFMSEPTGPGTKSWADWNGYGALLGRVLARTARGAGEPFKFEVRRRGARVQVVAERLVRRPINPEIALQKTDGSSLGELALQETAPGRFETEIHWDSDEPFCAAARAGGAERLLTSGPRADESRETQVGRTASFPMLAASEVTRGESYGVSGTSFKLPASQGRAPTALKMVWPWFVLAALLFFIADIYLRRRAGGALEVN